MLKYVFLRASSARSHASDGLYAGFGERVLRRFYVGERSRWLLFFSAG